jgi:hypothetical protein
MAGLNLPISIYLTQKIGVSGVVWGTIVSGSVFTWIPMVFFLPAVLRRLQESANHTSDTRAFPHAE